MISIDALIHSTSESPDSIDFATTLAVIDGNYTFTPTAFKNGNADNKAGENSGSCKLFAFAEMFQLTADQTLALFGEHYRSVRDTPDGTDHQNIRNFIAQGWEGIEFLGEALSAR
ncbi:HopJ type III effector protein [Echinimonas agarilytica]|uniref:HopJ type III effector protein n=1 Tax=Echinimonas agarilytica TaxID=1215918 RepID=A0AA42B878_9GAMM|nr:HopJ type III effector protein [Echinimonas agarilytica]MCM2680093.1 HopJ type III effector protein [Echinimonas agarilytica]